MRPHQWIKNLVVLAPLFFGKGLLEPSKLQGALSVFLLFCLLSGMVYVFNDIRDVEADRRHKKKRLRPIASGAVSIAMAWGLLAALAGALLVGFLVLVPPSAALSQVFLFYLAANLAYTVGLKHVSIVELFFVASGYVLRLIAGAVAVGIVPSSWILVCTALGALLLVVGKRRADMTQLNDPDGGRKVLQTYTVPFLDSLMVLLGASTLLAYLMFCVSEYGQLRYGSLVPLTAIFVSIGLFRFLQVVMMEGGGDSPSDLFIKDKVIAVAVLGWIGTFFLLLYI
jgi:4-hydroxybenzoate polyprenyltransferase